MPNSLEFDWPSLQVALEGHSYLDIPVLNLKSKAEAKTFLWSYGYDLDDPLQREEIWRIYFQSIAFVQNYLLEPEEKIPQEFLTRGGQADILRLLTEASKAQSTSGKWACALLRVMHIISHLDNDIRLEHFSYAREQIFARIDQHLKSEGGRRWTFAAPNQSVPLLRCIRKSRKERSSILMKLLSKPSTVVEEIYDSLGFRFVTEGRLDAYRLIQALFDSGAVSAANIQPGRSLNSLIPSEIFREKIESLRRDMDKGLSDTMTKRRLQKIEEESLVSWSQVRNPFSSRWYRAIQFTCRQLIIAPDPTYRFWHEIKAELFKNKSTAATLAKIPITLREKKTFYYPFEIQIMDKESYVESIGGRSRHREYKDRQKLMARNRVLRDLV